LTIRCPVGAVRSAQVVRCASSKEECSDGHATDDWVAEPDVFISLRAEYWDAHPRRVPLVVEVSRSSARCDRVTKRMLYPLAEVDEDWVVDHTIGTVIAPRAFPDVEIDVAEVLPPTAS